MQDYNDQRILQELNPISHDICTELQKLHLNVRNVYEAYFRQGGNLVSRPNVCVLELSDLVNIFGQDTVKFHLFYRLFMTVRWARVRIKKSKTSRVMSLIFKHYNGSNFLFAATWMLIVIVLVINEQYVCENWYSKTSHIRRKKLFRRPQNHISSKLFSSKLV